MWERKKPPANKAERPRERVALSVALSGWAKIRYLPI